MVPAVAIARRIPSRLATRAHRPVDIASLAAFRILFGLISFVGIVRFLGSGWIEPMYGASFHFHYSGFGWLEGWSLTGMYVHYAVLAVLALAIAAGAWFRFVTPLFTIGFAYTQLIDVTNYLNHHYLVVLLGALLSVLPAHRAWSVDVWRRPELRLAAVPAWTVWILRFQIGVVYVFAGLAKAQPDWLLHAQPLNAWLSARTDTPWIGGWLDERWVAFAMSWAGILYDTTIVVWLSWRRTRLAAFAAVIGFHAATGYFFNIGMFPLIMTSSALIFFSPSWPRRWLGATAASAPPAATAASSPPAATAASSPPAAAAAPRVVGPIVGTALVVHVVVQLVLPIRHHLYPGVLTWNEDGMRFAWQVLVREKHGSVTFIVRVADGRRLEVPAHRYLTARQEREMAGQPDLIVQLARHIAAELRSTYGEVAVYAETRVSLNGRPAVRLVDPTVDLTHVRDLGPRTWVTPMPTTSPIHLRSRT